MNFPNLFYFHVSAEQLNTLLKPIENSSKKKWSIYGEFPFQF